MKNKLLARKIEKEKVSMSEKNQAENNNGYKFEDDDKYPSTFTGGAFAYFFINLFMLFITLITLGIAYPAVKCMYMRWEVKNTYINGRKLAFDGKGGQSRGNSRLGAGIHGYRGDYPHGMESGDLSRRHKPVPGQPESSAVLRCKP